MASPTRRGFLSLLAAAAAQPKSVMASPKGALRTLNEGIPPELQAILPDLKDPKNIWYDRPDRFWEDGVWEQWQHKFPKLSGRIYDLHDQGMYDKFDSEYQKMSDAIFNLVRKDPNAYKTLKEMGATSPEIQTMFSDFKDYSQGFYGNLIQSIAEQQNKVQSIQNDTRRQFGSSSSLRSSYDPDVDITYTNRGRSP